ncbi:MAG: hypothetical protein H0T51_08370 [Pirellulales bacterium]|nr:hypothetical protein [Pirellulales bacterium]
MRIACASTFVSLVLLSSATSALGETISTASYNMFGNLYAPGSGSLGSSKREIRFSGASLSPGGDTVVVERTLNESVEDRGRAAAELFAYASADIGSVKATAVANFEVAAPNLFNGGEVRDLRVTARAEWADITTTSAPQAAGRLLLHEGVIVFKGEILADITSLRSGGNSGLATVTASITTTAALPSPISGLPGAFAYAEDGLFGSGTRFVPATTVYPLTILVREGAPFDFRITLLVVAEGFATTGRFPDDSADVVIGQSAGVYSNTLTWGGITSVRDAETGELIEDWTITSESGFDYSRPYVVPETSSLVLLMTCLCALSPVRRHRRRTPAM